VLIFVCSARFLVLLCIVLSQQGIVNLLSLQEWNAMLVPEKRRIRVSVHLSALLLLK
jgi:hypothetical protein